MSSDIGQPISMQDVEKTKDVAQIERGNRQSATMLAPTRHATPPERAPLDDGSFQPELAFRLMLHSPPPMTMAPPPPPSFSSSSRILPKRTDSLLVNQKNAQLFSTIEDEVRDCRRVGTHGQEEDLRQALDRMIGRVEELVCCISVLSVLYIGGAFLEMGRVSDVDGMMSCSVGKSVLRFGTPHAALGIHGSRPDGGSYSLLSLKSYVSCSPKGLRRRGQCTHPFPLR